MKAMTKETGDVSRPVRFLRREQVLERTGLTPRGLESRMKARMFPVSVWLDARTQVWVEAEVDLWNEARVLDRDVGTKPEAYYRMREGARKGSLRQKRERQSPQA